MRTLLLLAAAAIAALGCPRRSAAEEFPAFNIAGYTSDVDPETPIAANEIRFAGLVNYTNEILFAAVAYLKAHPEVRFTRVGRGTFDTFKNGRANLYPTYQNAWESLQKPARSPLPSPFCRLIGILQNNRCKKPARSPLPSPSRPTSIPTAIGRWPSS